MAAPGRKIRRPIQQNARTMHKPDYWFSLSLNQILGAWRTLYSKQLAPIRPDEFRHLLIEQRRKYCRPLSIHKQNVYYSQQKLLGSICWTTSWKCTWLLHRKNWQRLLTSHSSWLQPLNAMSWILISRCRKPFKPGFIYDRNVGSGPRHSK